jgi:hypothetical protein
MVSILIIQPGIESFKAFRTEPVTQQGVGILHYIAFQGLPESRVIPYFMAV